MGTNNNQLKKLILDYGLYDDIINILEDIVRNGINVTPLSYYLKPKFHLNNDKISTEAHILLCILSSDLEHHDISTEFFTELKEYISFKLMDHKLLYTENIMYKRTHEFNIKYVRSLEALYIIIRNIYKFEFIEFPKELNNTKSDGE